MDDIKLVLGWLRMHTAGAKLRCSATGHEFDYDNGYIKACEVIQGELLRLIEECDDGSDGDKGLLGKEVP